MHDQAETPVGRARRKIAEGVARVERQRAIILELASSGHDVTAARRLLDVMMQSLRGMRVELTRLETEQGLRRA